MTPKMRTLYESALRKFRLAYPQMRQWPDQRVFEALFLATSRVKGSGIGVIGQNDSGELRFEIDLRRLDGSDGSDGSQ